MGILESIPLSDAEWARLWGALIQEVRSGRSNVHVMDLDRPDYHAAGTRQISRGGVLYITALAVGGVLQGSGKMGIHRLRRIDAP
jgi:hypothetical protein